MISSLFVGFTFLDVALATSLDVQPQVVTPNGLVAGTTITVESAVSAVSDDNVTSSIAVNQYLGIPFAAPPERFSTPTDPEPWNTTLNATSFQSACLQQFTSSYTEELFNYPGPPASESEDCLYLNVFTPATAPPSSGWPTLFWIYGGNLQFGCSNLGYYNGASLAGNQDVIVVTINYRTNVFGFPGSPGLTYDEQNLGFLDQRKALAWVHTNIESFSGNKSKVTIFGESSGGYSVKQLFALPPDPLPFSAVIMESEATGSGNSTVSWQLLAPQVGCSNTTAAEELACMRAANATEIKQIISSQALPFTPTLDGKTNIDYVGKLIKNGTVAQVPVMIGTNSDEGSIFAPSFQTVDALLKDELGNYTVLNAPIKATYPIAAGTTELNVISEILTDAIFTCPSSALANITAAAGHKTWRYYFNSSFPNTQPFIGAGAWHSSEISQVFGTYPTINVTTEQMVLSQFMQTAWAGFAKDPTGDGPGWTAVGAGPLDLETLGFGGESGDPGIAIAREKVDVRCEVFTPLLAIIGL